MGITNEASILTVKNYEHYSDIELFGMILGGVFLMFLACTVGIVLFSVMLVTYPLWIAFYIRKLRKEE